MAPGEALKVKRVLPSLHSVEGAGFPVRRPFPTALLRDLDPFILLDHMGPTDWAPGEAKGAPDHPHRGFETVTYMLEGRFRHKDSLGNTGVLGHRDVQWMTAGAGVVHSEMPHEDIVRAGGRVHGFQLWVNLPRKDKMVRPRYQDTPSAKMPEVRLEDGKSNVKVIAGSALGAESAIQTRIPITYLHATLWPGEELRHPVPKGHNAFAYVVEGDGQFGAQGAEAVEGDIVVLDQDGGDAVVRAPKDAPTPLSALLIAAQPIREPFLQYGPFVMTTEAEIRQAMRDYLEGRMGRIAPEIG
jgi:quercetin 2,3-dioxygenase